MKNSCGKASHASLQSARIDQAINVAISTVHRPKQYLHKLMSRLRKDLFVRLVVGAPNYQYLRRYSCNRFVKIIGIAASDWHQVKNYSVMHRASWNYWRCLVYGCRSQMRKGLLILEDDVLPAADWEPRLREIINRIESEYGEEYVLSLYTAYTDLGAPLNPDDLYRSYPVCAFGGTQAVFYPEPIRSGFAAYIKREGVETIRKPYDYLLGEYLQSTGVPLFITTPCLFQHIGKITTGLSLVYHHAAQFTKRNRLYSPAAITPENR